MDKEYKFFEELFRGYWILKCPHCALCKHCSDIWYDYTNGPYMAFCELHVDDTEHYLGRDCDKFELDLEDLHVVAIDDK